MWWKVLIFLLIFNRGAWVLKDRLEKSHYLKWEKKKKKNTALTKTSGKSWSRAGDTVSKKSTLGRATRFSNSQKALWEMVWAAVSLIFLTQTNGYGKLYVLWDWAPFLFWGLGGMARSQTVVSDRSWESHITCHSVTCMRVSRLLFIWENSKKSLL